jgi:4-hydroxy-tetrahydrodipicolinate reductase
MAPVPADTRDRPLCRAVLIGVSGRMGQALLRAAPGFPQLIVTGAIASAGSLALGRDAGELAGLGAANLPVTSDLPGTLAEADVVIDFSSAVGTAATVAACRAAHKPLLLGTTGFAATLEPQLGAAAREIPLLVAANTSLGATLLVALTRTAAKSLPVSFDIDILDLHHRLKRDAPSGTALALGRAAAQGRGVTPPTADEALAPPARPRPEGEIAFATLRAGDGVGEHTVLFSGHGETLALTHRASDRAIFARGALAAALWLVSQPPGRYDMQDFLGLKTAT